MHPQNINKQKASGSLGGSYLLAPGPTPLIKYELSSGLNVKLVCRFPKKVTRMQRRGHRHQEVASAVSKLLDQNANSGTRPGPSLQAISSQAPPDPQGLFMGGKPFCRSLFSNHLHCWLIPFVCCSSVHMYTVIITPYT